MKKDNIYIDIDDEITGIIDKVQNSDSSIVALILPKRCTVMQSSVNMKILKKISEESGKNLVLITSESAVLALAGTIGMYVAKSIQSKPYIPTSVDTEKLAKTLENNGAQEGVDFSKSIEELENDVRTADDTSKDSPIEIGDEPVKDDKKGESGKTEKKTKNRPEIPNFDRFRNRLFLIGGGLILLITFLIFSMFVWPKASVTITTENKSIPVELTVTAKPSATAVDVKGKIIPATVKSEDKTANKSFSATGQQNKGNKASGKVRFSVPCSAVDDSAITIPSGTGVSTGGLTFITQGSATLTTLSWAGGCRISSDEVGVTAQNAGDQYNVNSGRTFAVSGYPSVSATNADGMSGGTNNMVTVVSQSDCDDAKDAISNANNDSYKNQLSEELKGLGLTPVKETYTNNAGAVSCNPAVGQQASTATASITFKVTMMGLSTTGLEQIIKENIKKQLKPSQSIIKTGASSATISVQEKNREGDVILKISTDVEVGAPQDAESVAKAIAGKKKGDSLVIIKSHPGVTDAKITYSPFWVYKTPSNAKRISVKYISNVTN
ncbi:hypothetical protein KBB76_03040 [Candidatus Saccharibacteria bacterium]|jgi:hypothetical protein|nr:hypothetical protein [Candidatus Saccharibacteria bacterium]